MTLPKFIIGMIAVILIVAIWSYADSASASVVAIRVVACAVLLQVGYFLVVLAMVMFSPKQVPGPETKSGSESNASKQADSLTSPGSPG